MPPCNQDEIARLEAVDQELAAADAEFEHHLRRYGDQFERIGSDWGFATDVERLRKNRKRIARDRAKIAARINSLNPD